MPLFKGWCSSEVLQPVILVDAGDERVIDVLETTEMPENRKKAVGSITQLKCIYTNPHSMGNTEKKLQAIVQQENYDTIVIMETWWDESHNWNAATDGYKLLRRDRQGKISGLTMQSCLGKTQF
ncbi:rna-directed dna polymerase from mobile element jockey-like [Willisornis vidua]|uniref:Rna-directed dna polymerase from mobile element jockey-like n=1 Tax=Willisornis vidua TaxID=1566151 RepID=A0ABQ9CS07_9PASS|nr:rna-directed dna polymerase from mobile element jockey-like [Willisornis vidua]